MKFRFTRSKQTPSSPNEHADGNRRFITQCYRQFLQRAADNDGLDSYFNRLNQGAIDHAGVMEEMLASDEYLQLSATYDYKTDAALCNHLPAFNTPLVERLQQCSKLPQDQYQTLWGQIFQAERELVIGQQEYGRQHKQRFWELCNAVVELTQDKTAAKALEFGISEFSGIYQTLCPSLSLDCADRPTGDDYIGFNANTSLRVSGGQQFIGVDLNVPRTLLSDQYRALHNQYDLVLFTEVLEHLTANPVDILEQLVTLLTEDGYLYLTTPNFFRRENRHKMDQRENPQEVYPAGEDNWDAHHHHREYALKELLGFVEAAGGKTEAFYFSSCWDEDIPANQSDWGNMVFIIKRADLTQP